MKKFSKEQLEAIQTLDKHKAVIAGAGTGKTTVLIARIHYLLSNGINPKEILAITFTKKAANEMKERLKNDDVLVMTFDAFCYKLINNKDIKIIENSNLFSKKEILSFNLYDSNLRLGNIPNKYHDYVLYKNNHNLYDFNDIEYMALKIIKTNLISFNYLLLDEFQDTNNLQFKIFETLVSNQTNTFIVGDPDQSIYKFRGANLKLINTYINKYQATLTVLKENYRSNTSIISTANNLIKNNKDRIKKNLFPIKENYGLVKILFFYNEVLEYNYIVRLIDNLNKKNKSIAILFRNHEQGYLYKKHYYNVLFNISILSIHESKGLEFDIVFLIGINKDIIPSINSNNELIEEERRLLFVGITRAKEKLYISVNNKKSKFIKEINYRK